MEKPGLNEGIETVDGCRAVLGWWSNLRRQDYVICVDDYSRLCCRRQ